tara:strand:+ start:225 stop:851 length:627 start_codon:yes stop_codon:yes gene_type:complete
MIKNMRNQIFYELFIKNIIYGKKIIIWNTWPNNYMGIEWEHKWDDIKEGRHWFHFIIKNGPRYWMIDNAIDHSNDKSKSKQKNGLTFYKRAKLDLKTISPNIRNKEMIPWCPIKVERDTTWIYKKYKPVYILTDDKSRKWILQSTTQHKVFEYNCYLYKLKINGYSLPPNWSYKIHNPLLNLYARSKNKVATILRDPFKNTFMLYNCA